MNSKYSTPNWVNHNLYPFQSKYVQLQFGNMHYIDEGNGEILLFVHGTPTWSFLYRDFIKEFSKGNRCIAIDHLGFGLSECPSSFSGTPQDHAKNLNEFIVKLDLQNITLVVHDFGGPIGLAAGIQNSSRIKRVVLFNSWLWETKSNKDSLKIDKLINSWLGKVLYLNFNFSPKVLLKKGFADKSKLTKDVHQQYLKPFPTKVSRISLLNLAKALVDSSDWYQNQWEKLDALADKEWLILWGTKDQFITTEYLNKWKARLPKAKVIELNCGHFVQEEMPNESIVEIHNFIGKYCEDEHQRKAQP